MKYVWAFCWICFTFVFIEFIYVNSDDQYIIANIILNTGGSTHCTDNIQSVTENVGLSLIFKINGGSSCKHVLHLSPFMGYNDVCKPI